MTIVEFIEARLTEDEAIAHGAMIDQERGFYTHKTRRWVVEGVTEDSGKWVASGASDWTSHPQYTNHGGATVSRSSFPDEDCLWRSDSNCLGTAAPIADHIARWDPARVLREIEAKRAILAQHPLFDDAQWGVQCETCDEWWIDQGYGHAAPRVGPCPTLRALASVYVDHPDYDPSWALGEA